MAKLDKLTVSDMAELMGKLSTAFGGKRDIVAKTELYYDRLEHVPLSAVRHAVDRLLDEEHKYLPLVGTIKRYAREYQTARDPKKPKAPEEHPGMSCSSCGEAIAYHRMIVPSPRGILLAVHQRIRHTDACQYERQQSLELAMYGRQFADPLVEKVPWMEQAWDYVDPPAWVAPGEAFEVDAGQDWSAPIGPLPAQLHQLAEKKPERQDRRRSPAAAMPLADLVPKVTEKIEQGDAYEEPEPVS